MRVKREKKKGRKRGDKGTRLSYSFPFCRRGEGETRDNKKKIRERTCKPPSIVQLMSP